MGRSYSFPLPLPFHSHASYIPPQSYSFSLWRPLIYLYTGNTRHGKRIPIPGAIPFCEGFAFHRIPCQKSMSPMDRMRYGSHAQEGACSRPYKHVQVLLGQRLGLHKNIHISRKRITFSFRQFVHDESLFFPLWSFKLNDQTSDIIFRFHTPYFKFRINLGLISDMQQSLPLKKKFTLSASKKLLQFIHFK